MGLASSPMGMISSLLQLPSQLLGAALQGAAGRGDAASLNPQPLPPAESPLDKLLNARTAIDDFCGTVPPRPPIPPVGPGPFGF